MANRADPALLRRPVHLENTVEPVVDARIGKPERADLAMRTRGFVVRDTKPLVAEFDTAILLAPPPLEFSQPSCPSVVISAVVAVFNWPSLYVGALNVVE